MKQASLKQAVGVMVAMGLFLGSLLFGVTQPASAMPLGTEFTTALGGAFNGMTLVANAGGEDLRNAVDDKLATAYGNKID
ncbi:MAG: photosystem II protein, partial [Cyanobacteria bacterium J06632_3]